METRKQLLKRLCQNSNTARQRALEAELRRKGIQIGNAEGIFVAPGRAGTL